MVLVAFLKQLLFQAVEDATELNGEYGASGAQYLTSLVTEARASRAGWDSKSVPREPSDTQVTYQVRSATITVCDSNIQHTSSEDPRQCSSYTVIMSISGSVRSV